jgi:glycosyltransferase involved in cell wall biosynthesis
VKTAPTNSRQQSSNASFNVDQRIAVVIPALNEEMSIGLVVRDIPRPLVSDIIVIDNGSSDHTAECAREAGATVLTELRKGYGYACRLGIDHAIKYRSDIIVFLDGDHSDYPEELPQLVRPLQEQGYDLVIGSRMIGERERGAMLPQAIAGNWLASFLIRVFWGYKFTDLGPFRAIRADALQRMRMSDPTFGWTVEMQIKAAKMKLKCLEVPVRYRRRTGKSKVTGTFSGTMKASAKILYTILKYVFVKI